MAGRFEARSNVDRAFVLIGRATETGFVTGSRPVGLPVTLVLATVITYLVSKVSHRVPPCHDSS